MRNITTSEFKKEIYDFSNDLPFKLKNEKPTVIMFSGSWCQPCKIVTPILDSIHDIHEDDFNLIKVDVDEEFEISQAFNIRSLPTILFAKKENYDTIIGSRSKNHYEGMINDMLD
jgi:thioredoxin-like negative regulator of GroEL